MSALDPIIYILAFVAAVMFVQTAAGLFFRSQDKTRRINRRLSMLDSGLSREEVFSALVRRSPSEKFSNRRLLSLNDQFERYLRQAGLSLTPFQVLGITAGAAAALWLVGLSLASSGAGPGILVNGLISMLGAVALSVAGVWIWIRIRRNARIKKLNEQLPLALDIVNRAIRAGHPVISAVQLAGDELSDPIGSEFGLIVDETTYGVEFKEALANLARRTGSPDAHFFAVSVSIQSETGGNLAEILQGLATVMRGRQTLSKRVRALASEGRASAMLLTVLPVLMVGFQLLFNPTLYTAKFGDPIFWPVVILTAGIYLFGWVLVHRIINFKY